MEEQRQIIATFKIEIKTNKGPAKNKNKNNPEFPNMVGQVLKSSPAVMRAPKGEDKKEEVMRRNSKGQGPPDSYGTLRQRAKELEMPKSMSLKLHIGTS